MGLSHVVGPDKPENALLMLHGYGSNGSNMLSYGRQLSAFLPHTLFVAPDAPDSVGPDAYVWYDLFAEEGTDSPLAQEKYCRQLQDVCLKKSLFISDLVDKIKVKYSLKNHQIGLLGFSQGGLLALVTGLTLQPSLVCVVASSSIPLVKGGPVEKLIRSRPPCLLTHGQADDVVPIVAASVTQQTLQKDKVPVSVCLSPNLSHGIDENCAQATIRFLKSLWEK